LAHLPLFPAALALEVLAESADLVGHGLVGRGARQEAADPADAVGRRLLLDEPRLQEELAKLLQRGLELAHRQTTSAGLVGNGCARVSAEDRQPIALADQGLVSAPV